MVIALLHLEIHIPYAHSLKEKRMVVQRLKDRLRAKYNVAVSEVDHQELWQRAQVSVVSIGPDRGYLEQRINSVADEAERILPGCTVQGSIEFM